MKPRDCDVLLRSVAERLVGFRSAFKICRREFSEEAVHDLRVAARRLLAALDLGRALAPSPSLQKARRTLKVFLDELDELRDTQVMLVNTSGLLEAFPQLTTVVTRLKNREKKLLRAAESKLKKSRLSEMSARVEKVRAKLEEAICGRGFRVHLLRAVDDSFGKAAQAHGQVETQQPATIHRLRIAFKKFRYAVEIAVPSLVNYPESNFERMHAYQSRMGDVQDVQLLLQVLNDFSDNGSSADLEAVRQTLEARRAELISAFLNSKDDLSTFWRKTPKENFPWEGPDETLHRSSRNRRRSGLSRSGSRQPEAADRQGAQEDAPDRAGPEGIGGGG